MARCNTGIAHDVILLSGRAGGMVGALLKLSVESLLCAVLAVSMVVITAAGDAVVPRDSAPT